MKKFKTIVKVISWILLLSLGVLMLTFWTDIPDIVGIHVNLAGQVDNYGNKSILLIVWCVVVVVNILYTLDYRVLNLDGSFSIERKYPFIYDAMFLFAIIALFIFYIARMFAS